MRARAATMRRRMAGRLGPGGGPGSGGVSALFSPEAEVLEEGEGELAQEHVVVQAAPAPTLEVVQPQLFLELLMQLLAYPARLDRDGQGLECRGGGKVGQVVLALAGRATGQTHEIRSLNATLDHGHSLYRFKRRG